MNKKEIIYVPNQIWLIMAFHLVYRDNQQLKQKNKKRKTLWQIIQF